MIKLVTTFKKAVAKLGFKKAVAELAFKKAVADIAFKKAQAQLYFKKGVASIKLGEFLIFRFFFDALGITDLSEKDIGKAASDLQGMDDKTVIDLVKVQADAFGAIDSAALDSSKSLGHTGSVADQINTLGVGKGITNSASVDESIRIETGFNRTLTDSFVAAEEIQLNPVKAFSDLTAFSDSAAVESSKIASDAASIEDALSISPSKILADSSALEDAKTVDFFKVILESAGVTDDLDGEASTDDEQEMNFTKVTSNLASIADALAYSMNSGLSDTMGASDSGALRGQGYCAFDYFAEDYVGYQQSF